MRRVALPSGGSIFTTSAPSPASSKPGIFGTLVGDLDDAQSGQHARAGIAHHLAGSAFDRAGIRHDVCSLTAPVMAAFAAASPAAWR